MGSGCEPTTNNKMQHMLNLACRSHCRHGPHSTTSLIIKCDVCQMWLVRSQSKPANHETKLLQALKGKPNEAVTSTTEPQQPKPSQHAMFGGRCCRKHRETRRFCAHAHAARLRLQAFVAMLRARLPEARASQAAQRTRIDYQTRMESERASR